MERGLRTKVNPVDDICNVDIILNEDDDFSEQDQLLLKELNRIICYIDNPYLWRELNTFDLQLRERLKEKH